MNMGFLETVLVTSSWGVFALIHVIIFILMKKDNVTMPRKILLIYGIPLCYTIGCLLTPPDLISSLIISIPCIIIYAAISACVVLFCNDVPNNCEQAALSGRPKVHPSAAVFENEQ